MITLHSPTAWQRHDNLLSLDTLMNTDTELQYKHDDGGTVNNSMNDLMMQPSSHWTSMELSHIMISSLPHYHIQMLFSIVGFTANILWNSRWISSPTMNTISSLTLRGPVFARRQSWWIHSWNRCMQSALKTFTCCWMDDYYSVLSWKRMESITGVECWQIIQGDSHDFPAVFQGITNSDVMRIHDWIHHWFNAMFPIIMFQINHPAWIHRMHYSQHPKHDYYRFIAASGYCRIECQWTMLDWLHSHCGYKCVIMLRNAVKWHHACIRHETD